MLIARNGPHWLRGKSYAGPGTIHNPVIVSDCQVSSPLLTLSLQIYVNVSPIWTELEMGVNVCRDAGDRVMTRFYELTRPVTQAVSGPSRVSGPVSLRSSRHHDTGPGS